MMEDFINKFPDQFRYKPVITNNDIEYPISSCIVVGMGGSALGAELLSAYDPAFNLRIHRDYGLPLNRSGKELVIASSYSGNTEETIDAYSQAISAGHQVVAVSLGGDLSRKAKEGSLPLIIFDDTGIPPRMSVGFNVVALETILKNMNSLSQLELLPEILEQKMKALSEQGVQIAENFRGKIPIIYSSENNKALAYYWKITFNETGKIPAFCNVFPELNHNEMTGFDAVENTQNFLENFKVIFLRDDADHPRIVKRMNICRQYYENRGLPTENLSINGATRWEKIFTTVILGMWTAFRTAQYNGADPDTVPMVESFKKEMDND